jgi:hypothetical protein
LNETFKLAIVTAIFSFALPELGWAAGSADIQSVLSNETLTSNLGSTIYGLSMAAYLMGTFMMVSGALKLKNHAENPAGEKLAPGVARVIGGGALIGLPALTKAIAGSTGLTGDQADFVSFTNPF